MTPTSADWLWAQQRIAAITPQCRNRLAQFRDGLPMRYLDLYSLERAGLVASLVGGEYVVLPGVLEVFAAQYGQTGGVVHHMRTVTGGSDETKVELFASVPGAIDFSQYGKAQGKRPDGKADKAAVVVAVPPAGLTRLCAGVGNPIGDIVKKMRRPA